MTDKPEVFSEKIDPSPHDREFQWMKNKATGLSEKIDTSIRKKVFLQVIIATYGIWLAYMFWSSSFYLFYKNWFMSITMALGSFIAGATSEGGGAVAFPVMTLLFGIKPAVARNFSLAIQSVGMTAAAYTIYRLRIPVEWNAVRYVTLGGFFGIILGTLFVVPIMSPSYTKIFFTSLWLAFALSLYWVNKNRERRIYSQIHHPDRPSINKLMVVGFLGGVVTSLTGSGIDIFTFSLLTLYFHISEKVATPTSVVLMAFNSMVGFTFHTVILRDFQLEAFQYWLVCIPVVVIGAPAGAKFISSKTRGFIAGFLYIAIVTQFIGAFLIIRPDLYLSLFSLVIFVLGTLLFYRMNIYGRREIEILKEKLELM